MLAKALPPDADTFVLFGTSHAPMREPFSLCRKAFDTQLGRMDADKESIDAIAAACDFDPYADQFSHKREHSLEFQAVFLSQRGSRALRLWARARPRGSVMQARAQGIVQARSRPRPVAIVLPLPRWRREADE